MITNLTSGYGLKQKVSEIDTDSIRVDGMGAEPTSRVLDGSSDHGFDAEYAENGVTKDGRAVRIIYLFMADQMENEDTGAWPWDDAIARVELVEE